MIQNLTINYSCDGIEVTLSANDNAPLGNPPYNMAAMFAKVMRDSNANEKIVIQELAEAFDYEIKNPNESA